MSIHHHPAVVHELHHTSHNIVQYRVTKETSSHTCENYYESPDGGIINSFFKNPLTEKEDC